MGDKTMLELLSHKWNGRIELICISHALNTCHLFLLFNCNFVPGDQNLPVYLTMQPGSTAILLLL